MQNDVIAKHHFSGGGARLRIPSFSVGPSTLWQAARALHLQCMLACYSARKRSASAREVLMLSRHATPSTGTPLRAVQARQAHTHKYAHDALTHQHHPLTVYQVEGAMQAGSLHHRVGEAATGGHGKRQYVRLSKKRRSLLVVVCTHGRVRAHHLVRWAASYRICNV